MRLRMEKKENHSRSVPCVALSLAASKWLEETNYYRETATLVHDSGVARDDAMAPMTNLRILYRMYNPPKSNITLTVRVSLTSHYD